MTLDDADTLARVDRSDALGDVLGSGGQWRAARELATERLDLDGVTAVVVTGMGGSGICADVVSVLAAESLRLPVVAHKGYGLPAWVGPSTAVIAISYSGATEETRSSFAEAARRGARRLAIASGGEIADACAGDGSPCVIVPAGRQPRHSLGFLVVPALVALGLDEGLDEAVDVLDALARSLAPDVPEPRNPAKSLATRLAVPDEVSLLVGATGAGAVAASRLKSQLAENAKVRAMVWELPESHHNDVVAWHEAGGAAVRGGLVLLRDTDGEHERVRLRFDISEVLLAGRVRWRDTLAATGSSLLARMASLVLQADVVSIYTAVALGRDPTPIVAIDDVKRRLAAPAPASA